MKRLFDEHKIRQVRFLETDWQFAVDRNDIGEKEKWYLTFPKGEFTTIPNVWNNEKGLTDYEGRVWYQNTFYFEGTTARLVFEAVMTECKIWVDGNYIGYHYGGFCQFDFLIKNITKGCHNLVIMVDNRFDKQSIPQTVVDWYHYGGITRSVSVENLSGISILNYKFDYTLSKKLKNAKCNVSLELHNCSHKKRTDIISITLNDEIVCTIPVCIPANSSLEIKSENFQLNDIILWDTDNPYLYNIEIKTSTDDLIDRVGFRKIEVMNQKILLNNRELELRGVNRHEDYPTLGMSMTPSLMKKDLDIIIDMGCNSVRGSHYPNSRIFLDMLDSKGILFWSEIPIWGCGFWASTLGDSVVLNRGLDMHKEMVKYYYNHPSIIIWGMHNEIRSDYENGLKMTKLYYEYLKKHGGNRLVTYASIYYFTDLCFEYCDVISLNQYYGWYDHEIEDWESFLMEFDEHRNKIGMSLKPVIISEFGGAAYYGHVTFDCVKWTEEYQAKLLGHCLNFFHKCPFIVGSYIWQYCDTRSDMGLAKARTLNNKGILSDSRKPKMAYYKVKEAFTKFASEEKGK